MADRVLSQQEIENVFRSVQQKNPAEEMAQRAQPYDFRRPDRIAKDQLRSMHLIHETFARSIGSSLSAFLRAYVAVNLVSVEQLSFAEFSRSLPSPTCLINLGMTGFDNNALMELNPSILFPVLELILGGSSTNPAKIDREMTEIERAILDGFFRILIKDLKDAWRMVPAALDFRIDGYETDPQLLQILSPNEAVVAISIELRIGDIAGMMNIGIPSIIIKMLGQRMDQHLMRKSELTEAENDRILRLVRPSAVRVDVRLTGPTLSVRDLLNLKLDDVLTFDYPVQRPMNVSFNGRRKYLAQIVATGRKRAVELNEMVMLDD
jgi:flagellar motor switch protein FliM